MRYAMAYAFVSCLVIASTAASAGYHMLKVARTRRTRRLAAKPGKHRAGQPPTAVAYGPLLTYGLVRDEGAAQGAPA